MKILRSILAIGLLLFIGGLIWILKGESGGTDRPLNKEVAEYKCQRWFPLYAGSIYCKWWTGGTQEWVHQARFHYPEENEKECFDTLMSDRLNTRGKRIEIQEDKRIKLADKHGPSKSWWDVKSKPGLIHIGPDSIKSYGDYVWIDTVNNTVYWVSMH